MRILNVDTIVTRKVTFLAVIASSLLAFAAAAGLLPTVSYVPPGSVSVKAGGSVTVPLVFHVPAGYKVCAGGDETFSAAQLLLHPPTGVAVTTKYPKTIAAKFETYERPVYLYNGDVTVRATIEVPSTASPGPMTIAGDFKYQLFDTRSVRPPATVPVTFTVQVNGGKRAKSRH